MRYVVAMCILIFYTPILLAGDEMSMWEQLQKDKEFQTNILKEFALYYCLDIYNEPKTKSKDDIFAVVTVKNDGRKEAMMEYVIRLKNNTPQKCPSCLLNTCITMYEKKKFLIDVQNIIEEFCKECR